MELLERLGLRGGVFEGRVAVVTGAARGLGEQVARGLASLGADTVILDIRDRGEAVAEDIRAKGGKAGFLQVDLADLARLDEVQQDILATRGRVDMLVNNAAKLYGMRLVDTPMEVWDELHQSTVRASAFLISKFLPVMQRNRSGVIANTIAAEGLSYGAYFSSAMVGQRSMALSLAGEIRKEDGVSVFGFAPGVMDTGLVHEDDSTLKFYGITSEEWIRNFVSNPGYEGLMPPGDCAASYVYCLAHAPEYHGQIADAFHPLISHGIITPDDRDELAGITDNVDAAVRQCSEYVQGISSLNRNLEVRIEERTRELEEANRQLAEQKRYIEGISTKISRYLPQQLYQSIFSGDSAAEIGTRRRQLTVFFSDIRGFTQRAERLEPEALSEILNTYFSAMTEIARAHGATIDKFIGDAILAFFGDPDSDGPERDAERCVGMAIDMQRQTGALRGAFARLGLREPLEIRIGINSGYCTVGNFGSYERMDYTIIGTPVNIAARLQEAAAPNGIVISDSTQALIGNRFALRSIGELSLKGIAGAIGAYEVEFDPAPADEAEQRPDDQLELLRAQFARVDLDRLDDAERARLLEQLANLLKG